MPDIRSALPPTCDVLPNPDINTSDTLLKRWSQVLVSAPFAIVTPSSVDDIIATIHYASAQNLKLIPSGGARGFYVPITHDVILLDLCRFSSVDLDEEKKEVTFGGGCVSGPLMKGLAEKGFYTATPNSNGVGITGALLGGLNHPLVGLHGMGIDMVKQFTIIPFSMPDGGELRPVTLSRASVGEEKKLFDVLRGAGHGMGVVLNATMEVHSLAELHLDEGDKVWQRTLVFPPDALAIANDAYLELQSNAHPNMSFFLGFMRAPPSTPRPGAPMILLSMSFFGPTQEAEKAAKVTFSEAVLSKAVTATSILTRFGDIHNALDPLNVPGGYKELHGAFVNSITASSLSGIFDAFLSFTHDNPSRFGSSIILPTSNTATCESLTSPSDFYNPRDRGIYVQVKTSYPTPEGKADADAFANTALKLAREEDSRNGRRGWSFASNMVEGMSLTQIYTSDQIREVSRVRSVWDQQSVGWCPVADEWRSYTRSRQMGAKPGTLLEDVLNGEAS